MKLSNTYLVNLGVEIKKHTCFLTVEFLNFQFDFSLQIVSGRPRQATSALLHLTGVAVGFVGQLRGLRKSIDAAGKANTLCGVLRSKRQLEALPTSGRL